MHQLGPLLSEQRERNDEYGRDLGSDTTSIGSDSGGAQDHPRTQGVDNFAIILNYFYFHDRSSVRN